MSDESGYGVRECRGHWHVTHGGEDIVLPGDPFASEAEACEAMYVAKDIEALRYASSQSFLAFEASLPGNGLHCPTCGGRTNATDSLAGASVPAFDFSRSIPDAVAPPEAAPPRATTDCECGHDAGSHSSLRFNCLATRDGHHATRCTCRKFTPNAPSHSGARNS